MRSAKGSTSLHCRRGAAVAAATISNRIAQAVLLRKRSLVHDLLNQCLGTIGDNRTIIGSAAVTGDDWLLLSLASPTPGR